MPEGLGRGAAIEKCGRPSQGVGSLAVVSLPDIPADSVLAQLFEQEAAREATIWFSLPGGQKLFGQGDASDQLFFLRTGRLGAFRRDEGQENQFLGVIRPGEPAGEMALIAEVPHSADVVALGDSEVFAGPKAPFFAGCVSLTNQTWLAQPCTLLRSVRAASGNSGNARPSSMTRTPAR